MSSSKSCRLRAKGETIKFDTADGDKEYMIKPMINEQLLEVVKLGEQNKGMEAAMKMAKYSLNNHESNIMGDSGELEPFDDEEVKAMPSNFLLELLNIAKKVNGLDKMFDFQKGVKGVPLNHPTLNSPLNKLSSNNSEGVKNQNRQIIS